MTSPISPLSNHKYSTELEKNVADLWWTIDDSKGEITFELHINTTGWIALGISPGKCTFQFEFSMMKLIFNVAGGMKGADIGVGWIDQNGTVHFQVLQI